MFRQLIFTVSKFLDLILSPITLLSSIWFLFIRRVGIHEMKISRGIFSKIGVLPVIDHFYQPLINPHKHLLKSLRLDRNLPGIDFNIETQINLLDSFNFNDELKSFPLKKTNPKDFYFHNGSLMSGDSEYLYNIIRSLKPKNIIEIGSGHSTKMMLNGINKNYEEDNIKCELTCIEPYEEDLLKRLNINLIKERVEKVDIELFNQLDKSLV